MATIQLRTFMSRVCHSSPIAGLKPLKRDENDLFWLDQLLGGGLALPESAWNQEPEQPPFVLLLAGPPGTGKTTFALELCYNLAKNAQPQGGMAWRSLYVSAETGTDRIIENAQAFGWDRNYFTNYIPGTPLAHEKCTIYGSEYVQKHVDDEDYDEFFNAFVQTWLRNVGEGVWSADAIGSETNRLVGEERSPPDALPPDVVVIDSLNVFQPDPSSVYIIQDPNVGVGQKTLAEARRSSDTRISKTFRKLIRWVGKSGKSPRLLIVILDAFGDPGAHPFWEYLVDAAFRFDGNIGSGSYYTRTFQIVKIKTQEHAWGNQVFKIYSRQKRARGRIVPDATGGTFVFPSVHWQLDHSAEFAPSGAERVGFYRTGIQEFDSILGDENSSGFPPMQTTALVGRRGGMKSHLAYYFMLCHALGIAEINDPKNVLLISLRDDLNGAKYTLSKIVEAQGIASNGLELVDKLIETDRLEILYNAPGCITPNEFFHRVFVSLARKRDANEMELGGSKVSVPKRQTAEVVILNGLDHLEAKFPLCASEKVFVPALVTMFRNYKVCSVIISGEEGRVAGLAEIGAMADLLIKFSEVGKGDLGRTVPHGTQNPDSHSKQDAIRNLCKIPDSIELHQSSELTAVRVPAGQIGGRRGILGRTEDGALKFYPAPN